MIYLSRNPYFNSSCLFLILSSYVITPSQSLISYPLVPHHVTRRRERNLLGNVTSTASSLNVRRRDIAQQISGLYQGYGTHYIDLWCGTPPQRQTVIVDTGSG